MLFEMFVELPPPFIICSLGSSERVCGPAIVEAHTAPRVVPIRSGDIVTFRLLRQHFQSETFVTLSHLNPPVSILVRSVAHRFMR